MNPPPARDPPPVRVVSFSVTELFVDVVPRESDLTLLDRIAPSGVSVAGAVVLCEQPAKTPSAAARTAFRRTIVLLLSFSVKW
jgi:hypothetical protein